MTQHSIFSLPLLQAINDWQRGGDHEQKIRRGAALKSACAELPPRYRQPPAICYRQEAHTGSRTWQLLIGDKLPETIAAWTNSLDVAKTLKGGVPPEGLQGVIFRISPEPEQVIVNIASLYADPAFLEAAESKKAEIKGYYSGIGDYGDSQHEVVLELGSLQLVTVFSYGGFAGSLDQLTKAFYEEHGFPPSEHELAQMRPLVGSANWLSPDGTFRAIERTLDRAAARRWLPAIDAEEATNSQ